MNELNDLFQEHPFNDLVHVFPVMTRDEFAALVASIRQRGLLDPITLWRGQIVDGRHRFLACIKAGAPPRFEHLPDDADPLEHVLNKNQDRRDTSISQKAVSAYKVTSRSGPGRPRKDDQDNPERPYTQQEAAKRFGVSRSQVNAAGRVMSPDSQAHPALRRAVEQGRVTIYDGGKVVDEPPGIQREALARVVRGRARTIAGAAREVKREIGQREDALARESNLARTIGDAVTLHRSSVADLHKLVAPASVDAVITHPPTDARDLHPFSELAAFAAHALRPAGVLAVLASATNLPQVIGHLQHPDLRWVIELDLQFSGIQGRSGSPYWVNLRRRPLLVYAKPGFRLSGGDDVIVVPPPEDPSRGLGRRNSLEVGMALAVQRFTRPGQVVCDPFLLGRAGTALGARRNGCTFIGADRDQSCIQRVWKALLEAEERDHPEPAGRTGHDARESD